MKFDTSYMQQSLQPANLKRLIEEITPKIIALKAKLKFDAIAFRGFSGASVAFPLSYATGIPLLLVRKSNDHGKAVDNSHGLSIEGDPTIDVNRYIILDDFVCTGETIHSTIKTISSYVKRRWLAWPQDFTKPRKQPKCVGIVLYTKSYRKGHTIPINGKEMEPIYLAAETPSGV